MRTSSAGRPTEASVSDRWRFRPEDPADRLRARMGVGGLVWVGGAVLATAARLGVGPRRRLERTWARMALRHLRLEVRWSGLDRIDPAERYVVAPLHEGFADVIPLLLLPLTTRFLVRDELFDQPLLGAYLRAAGHICTPTVADRRSLRRLYAEVGRVFDGGESVTVFPQGTILGIEAAFRPGVGRLARRFRRPLLPVVLSGGHRVWEHPYASTLRYGQAMTVEVLTPLGPAALDPVSLRRLEREMKERALSSATPPRRFVPERDGWWDGYEYEIDPDFPELARRVEMHRRRLD